MPLILLHTQPKVRPTGSFQLQTSGFMLLKCLPFNFLFLYGFLTDPKDNISYKHLVPWIGMYSQGFGCQK